jgi:hypothetical protein
MENSPGCRYPAPSESISSWIVTNSWSDWIRTWRVVLCELGGARDRGEVEQPVLEHVQEEQRAHAQRAARVGRAQQPRGQARALGHREVK